MCASACDSIPTDGYRLVAEGVGVDRPIGELLMSVTGAMAAGNWNRLKVCANDACQRAFYDSSRNRSGRWCSMATCGNRMKGRAYRQRHGSQSVPSAACRPTAPKRRARNRVPSMITESADLRRAQERPGARAGPRHRDAQHGQGRRDQRLERRTQDRADHARVPAQGRDRAQRSLGPGRAWARRK